MNKLKTATECLSESGINIMSMDDKFNSQLLYAMERYAEGSESYWKKRCEAAEMLMQFQCYDSTNPCNDFKEYHDAGISWQQLKSSIGTEGQDETWLELFNDLDKWSRSMKSSEDTLPKIQELKTKYQLMKKIDGERPLV